MNLLTLMMMMTTVIFMTNVLWKWSKVFLVIVLLEGVSVVLMAMFFTTSSCFTILMFTIFSFFVSEALILLSSLYSCLRVSGSTFSSVSLL